MPKILSYRKITDAYTTHVLFEPDYQDGSERITELCGIDGLTYVVVPDGVELPVQPTQIQQSLAEVSLSPELRRQIKDKSVHVALIRKRVVEHIRLRYSVNNELKMHRTGPTPESSEYFDYCEACTAWGRAEKAKLGL